MYKIDLEVEAESRIITATIWLKFGQILQLRGDH